MYSFKKNKFTLTICKNMLRALFIIFNRKQ